MATQSPVMRLPETALDAGTTLLETTARGVLMDFMVMQPGVHLKTASHAHVLTPCHPTSFLQLAFWTLTISQRATPAHQAILAETVNNVLLATVATLSSLAVAVNLQEVAADSL